MNRITQRRIGLKPGIVNVMNFFEKVICVYLMMDHQALERRAVLKVKLLLDLARVLARQLEQLRHIARHLHVDL